MHSLYMGCFAAVIILGSADGCRAQGSIMLVGGGAESYGGWSDEPYQWFVDESDSGIIINIDVDAASSWYPGYFRSLGAAEGSHALQIANATAANDMATYTDLISASGIFIEGGDQWDYVNIWKGTLVEDAIHRVFAAGGAIGGTSAGLAILGEVVFDARYGNIYPEEAAYDPYDYHLTFTDDFLTILPDVIADSHFNTRGRIGRLVPFIARRIQDFGDSTIIGIGVEEKTAFCIGSDRTATVYGECVTVIRAGEYSTVKCSSGVPLSCTDVKFDQMLHGAVYDLYEGNVLSPGSFLETLEGPCPPPPQYPTTVLSGSMETTADSGEVRVTGVTEDPDNWWYGDLGLVPGSAAVPRTVIMPRMWTDPDYFANRWIGMLYGVVENPFFLGFIIDAGGTMSVSADGYVSVDNIGYVLDTCPAEFLGSNVYNIPGLISARLDILAPDDTLDLNPPEKITDLDVGLSSGRYDIMLTWSEPRDLSGIHHYNVYRVDQPHGSLIGLVPRDSVVDTLYIDTGAAGSPDQQYYYAITSVDSLGRESIPSNRVGVLSYGVNVSGLK